jgi:hypothetical protein
MVIERHMVLFDMHGRSYRFSMCKAQCPMALPSPEDLKTLVAMWLALWIY